MSWQGKTCKQSYYLPSILLDLACDLTGGLETVCRRRQCIYDVRDGLLTISAELNIGTGY